MYLLWTGSGRCFGYREDDDLWTCDGKHVGKFYDVEVYGPDGKYLGEIYCEKLVRNTSKSSWMKSVFVPYGRKGAVGKSGSQQVPEE